MVSRMCPHADVCPVCAGTTNVDPRAVRRYRAMYCVDGWQECARYAVAAEVGMARVPAEISPEDHPRAYELVSARWLRRASSPAAAVFSAW